jgi:hypothetical protein
MTVVTTEYNDSVDAMLREKERQEGFLASLAMTGV